MFVKIGLTRSDISFAEGNLYTILWLKQSKVNIEHTKVKIIQTDTGEHICLVATLKQLFTQDIQPANVSLFCLQLVAFFY